VREKNMTGPAVVWMERGPPTNRESARSATIPETLVHISCVRCPVLWQWFLQPGFRPSLTLAGLMCKFLWLIYH
jgi:hypothetical protein